ncbi:MAG TPA: DciA family protein [Patescibacteria group bacterium]|nr:DciA family protein [Patescibacteria group bacterium]
MRSISNILQDKSNSSPVLRQVNAAVAVETANQILIEMFGGKITDAASAMYLKNSTLAIACLSSTAAQAIKLQEKHFIEQINQQVGRDMVKRVQYLS